MKYLQWDIIQVVAFGIIVWIWQRLGLSERAVLIGNIVAIILLIIVAFLTR